MDFVCILILEQQKFISMFGYVESKNGVIYLDNMLEELTESEEETENFIEY